MNQELADGLKNYAPNDPNVITLTNQFKVNYSELMLTFHETSFDTYNHGPMNERLKKDGELFVEKREKFWVESYYFDHLLKTTVFLMEKNHIPP